MHRRSSLTLSKPDTSWVTRAPTPSTRKGTLQAQVKAHWWKLVLTAPPSLVQCVSYHHCEGKGRVRKATKSPAQLLSNWTKLASLQRVRRHLTRHSESNSLWFTCKLIKTKGKRKSKLATGVYSSRAEAQIYKQLSPRGGGRIYTYQQAHMNECMRACKITGPNQLKVPLHKSQCHLGVGKRQAQKV